MLGDELDGPRGRIYQIKQVLEGQPASPTIRQHLDRCLTCRACETTCPSGVDYHRLLDIGRETVEQQLPRPVSQRLLRRFLIEVLAYPGRFQALLRLGQWLRPALPGRLRRLVPAPVKRLPKARSATGSRRVLVLGGCVQPGLAPDINEALALLLARLGIGIMQPGNTGCCGALPHHLGDTEKAAAMARRNIDAWYPALEQGAEAIVITASGCGAHVLDYPHLLAGDSAYAAKARHVVDHLRDPVQILADADTTTLNVRPAKARVAVHTPCTLQHALHLNGQVETLLRRLGYQVCEVQEGHLCCGSAGTYSILQAELSQKLRQRKLQALQVDHPDVVATANIGCLMHLASNDTVPVKHWLTLLAEDLA